MERLVVFLLVILMILSTFVACDEEYEEKTGDDEDEHMVTEQTVYEKYGLDEDSLTDYNGYEFRILTTGSLGGEHWSEYEFYYDNSLSADPLNQSVKERDEVLADVHNITVSYVEKSSMGMIDYAKQCLLSGSYEFDVISATLSGAALLAQEGMLANLLDYNDILDLNGDHWDQKANEALSIDGHLYFTVSDLTLTDKQAIWVVFVNNAMINDTPELINGYDDIYDMVRKGDWTIERMYNMCKSVTKDDGDGLWTDKDVYGRFGESFDLSALMRGCGAACIVKSDVGSFRCALTDDVQSFANSYDYALEMVNGDVSISSMELSQYYSDIWVEGLGDMLANKRVLFAPRGMNSCRLLSGVDADLSVIPLPKSNSEQREYYSIESAMANCVAVPYAVPDKERICEILETMTLISSKTTYKAYVDSLYGYGYFGEDRAIAEDMIELIFNSRCYDIGDIYYDRNGTHFGLYSVLPTGHFFPYEMERTFTRTQNILKYFLADMNEVFEKTSRY